MPHVSFYLLPETVADTESQLATEPAFFHAAAKLCADLYQAGQRVFVFCQNQADAELLDEVLWRFDPERFVPHNLVGEGPARGAPIEISWQPPGNARQVLINLSATVPPFSQRFQQIIEFVPAEEQLKVQARERFKFYRQLGLTPHTVQL